MAKHGEAARQLNQKIPHASERSVYGSFVKPKPDGAASLSRYWRASDARHSSSCTF